jgi:hypothetical protein
MQQPVRSSVERDEGERPLKAQLAFYLTGNRVRAGLDSINTRDLRPALFARYRDLTALRYDFPLVLADGVDDSAAVQSLSGLFDNLLKRCADGPDGERMRKHALRLEREIRIRTTESTGSLSDKWAQAARHLEMQGDARLAESLERLRAALDVDGDLIDCGADAASRLCQHLWKAGYEDKACRFRAQLDALSTKLSDILRADLVRSEQGRSTEHLRESFGSTHRDAFDFAAMSRLLIEALPAATLSDRRRERICWILSVLRSQRFFPMQSTEAAVDIEPYGFIFKDCADAMAAYRERLPKGIEFAKALAMAELEVEGEYNEARHDSLFADFAPDSLADPDLFLPAYLICLRARDMRAQDYDTLFEAFSAGLPAEVLLEIDDILEPSPIAGGNPVVASRNTQIARMVMDLNTSYVLQASSSSLFQLRDAIRRGMAYAGPSLFNVFTGQTGGAELPPYLIAAAATESRAFPTFVYDPSAGSDWASRFRVVDNPQAELDWPIQTLSYEDEEHQCLSDSLAFTFIDFVACDCRYHKHFAGLSRDNWTSSMVPVSKFFVSDADGYAGKVPYIVMLNRDDRLQRVVVDQRLVREARRCVEMWRSLQELGGVHNSHAARLLARERELWEKQRPPAPATADIQSASVVPAAAKAAATSAASTIIGSEAEAAKSSDEPYIETPRCTSCNECTQINNKMFAYDANKQAFIADPAAGTYRQLVEAAESCQVAIIHPGKPRNPSEPGLDELVKRAEPFL